MINWCKWGIHDWETLAYASDSDIKSQVARDLNPKSIGAMCRSLEEYRSLYQNRVCMRCRKKDNSLEQRYEYWRKEIPLRERYERIRETKAKKIWDEK